MSVPVGITVPKLLPITGTFVPLFASYYAFLCVRVSRARIKSKQFLGDTSASKDLSSASASSDAASDPLTVSTRCQMNFAETVPLALFLGSVVEMNGGNRRALTVGLAGLFVARLLHVELGLRGKKALGWGRPVGHMSTLGFVVGMAGYAGWLVKGYWGL